MMAGSERTLNNSASNSAQGQNLRGLKALVIGMAVLIVMGTALVVGVIIKRIYDAGSVPAKASSIPASPAPGMALGMASATLRIPAAAGAAIGGIAAVDGRLAVWVKDGQGGKVMLIDPQTNQLAGTVALAPR